MYKRQVVYRDKWYTLFLFLVANSRHISMSFFLRTHSYQKRIIILKQWLPVVYLDKWYTLLLFLSTNSRQISMSYFLRTHSYQKRIVIFKKKWFPVVYRDKWYPFWMNRGDYKINFRKDLTFGRFWYTPEILKGTENGKGYTKNDKWKLGIKYRTSRMKKRYARAFTQTLKTSS